MDPPARLDHAEMGRFTLNENLDYVRRVRADGRVVLLVLDCGYEGPDRVPELANACAAVAARVYGRLDRLVADAEELAARRCLALEARIRTEQGKPPHAPEGFAKRLKLLDVTVNRDGGAVAFTVKTDHDLYNFALVRFGPRGAIRDVEIGGG